MKQLRWGSWGGAVVLLSGCFLHLIGRIGTTDGGATPPPTVPLRATSDRAGVGSCSAVACHGRAEPLGSQGILRNEHTTWIGSDRHAEAFATLESARSCAIMKKLGGGNATQDVRCLACHSTATVPAVANRTRDGVGCQSCHGPADSWLAEHTTEGWDSLDPAVKESRFGMTDLSVLSKRAGICAGCHVGAPAQDGLPLREVNHDLIAAGHPRLDFEFSAFMSSMPLHWDPARKAPDNLPDFPARCWTVGQAVSRQAALALLRDRARRAQAAGSWPEFAEYGCFSCHHDLRNETWRQSRPGTGAPSWGTWHFAKVAEGIDPEADTEIQKLRRLMADPGVAPREVAERAGAAETALRKWLKAHENDSLSVSQLKQRIDVLKDPKGLATDRSWDDAAQRFLALVPLHQARQGLDPQHPDLKLEKELEDRRNALAFPRGYNSPHREGR